MTQLRFVRKGKRKLMENTYARGDGTTGIFCLVGLQIVSVPVKCCGGRIKLPLHVFTFVHLS